MVWQRSCKVLSMVYKALTRVVHSGDKVLTGEYKYWLFDLFFDCPGLINPLTSACKVLSIHWQGVSSEVIVVEKDKMTEMEKSIGYKFRVANFYGYKNRVRNQPIPKLQNRGVCGSRKMMFAKRITYFKNERGINSKRGSLLSRCCFEWKRCKMITVFFCCKIFLFRKALVNVTKLRRGMWWVHAYKTVKFKITYPFENRCFLISWAIPAVIRGGTLIQQT